MATQKGEVYIVGVAGGEGVLTYGKRLENDGSCMGWCLFSLCSQDKLRILHPWGLGLTVDLGVVLRQTAWHRFHPCEGRRGCAYLLACLGIN